jgi:hypothetical protein
VKTIIVRSFKYLLAIVTVCVITLEIIGLIRWRMFFSACNSIVPGMKRSEVTRILGPPSAIMGSTLDKPSETEIREEWWFRPGRAFRIGFDVDEKVTSKLEAATELNSALERLEAHWFLY